ncbi:hypothetical protein EGW08_002763 [Elysia chlorotica]|uniref:Uncharacterized protein n=1 Tax=Elysia chlorotica TaxID=188477 RepID=A0A433U6J8_ELYCH|nr:hypothetical protein EGW08_002763 [Elysia chlorotica]
MPEHDHVSMKAEVDDVIQRTDCLSVSCNAPTEVTDAMNIETLLCEKQSSLLDVATDSCEDVKEEGCKVEYNSEVQPLNAFTYYDGEDDGKSYRTTKSMEEEENYKAFEPCTEKDNKVFETCIGGEKDDKAFDEDNKAFETCTGDEEDDKAFETCTGVEKDDKAFETFTGDEEDDKAFETFTGGEEDDKAFETFTSGGEESDKAFETFTGVEKDDKAFETFTSGEESDKAFETCTGDEERDKAFETYTGGEEDDKAFETCTGGEEDDKAFETFTGGEEDDKAFETCTGGEEDDKAFETFTGGEEDDKAFETCTGVEKDDKAFETCTGGEEDDKAFETCTGGEEDKAFETFTGVEEDDKAFETCTGGEEDDKAFETFTGGEEDDKAFETFTGGEEDDKAFETFTGVEEDDKAFETFTGGEKDDKAFDEDNKAFETFTGGEEDDKAFETCTGDEEDDKAFETFTGGEEDDKAFETCTGGEEDDKAFETFTSGEESDKAFETCAGVKEEDKAFDTFTGAEEDDKPFETRTDVEEGDKAFAENDKAFETFTSGEEDDKAFETFTGDEEDDKTFETFTGGEEDDKAFETFTGDEEDDKAFETCTGGEEDDKAFETFTAVERDYKAFETCTGDKEDDKAFETFTGVEKDDKVFDEDDKAFETFTGGEEDDKAFETFTGGEKDDKAFAEDDKVFENFTCDEEEDKIKHLKHVLDDKTFELCTGDEEEDDKAFATCTGGEGGNKTFAVDDKEFTEDDKAFAEDNKAFAEDNKAFAEDDKAFAEDDKAFETSTDDEEEDDKAFATCTGGEEGNKTFAVDDKAFAEDDKAFTEDEKAFAEESKAFTEDDKALEVGIDDEENNKVFEICTGYEEDNDAFAEDDKAFETCTGDEEDDKAFAEDDKAFETCAGDEEDDKAFAEDDKAFAEDDKAFETCTGDEEDDKAFAEDDKAFAEDDKAFAEDDKAFETCTGDEEDDKASAEDDKACAEDDKAIKTCTGDEEDYKAFAEDDKAFAEDDKAFETCAGYEENDKACAEDDKAIKTCTGDEEDHKAFAEDDKAFAEDDKAFETCTGGEDDKTFETCTGGEDDKALETRICEKEDYTSLKTVNMKSGENVSKMSNIVYSGNGDTYDTEFKYINTDVEDKCMSETIASGDEESEDYFRAEMALCTENHDKALKTTTTDCDDTENTVQIFNMGDKGSGDSVIETPTRSEVEAKREKRDKKRDGSEILTTDIDPEPMHSPHEVEVFDSTYVCDETYGSALDGTVADSGRAAGETACEAISSCDGDGDSYHTAVETSAVDPDRNLEGAGFETVCTDAGEEDIALVNASSVGNIEGFEGTFNAVLDCVTRDVSVKAGEIDVSDRQNDCTALDALATYTERPARESSRVQLEGLIHPGGETHPKPLVSVGPDRYVGGADNVLITLPISGEGSVDETFKTCIDYGREDDEIADGNKAQPYEYRDVTPEHAQHPSGLHNSNFETPQNLLSVKVEEDIEVLSTPHIDVENEQYSVLNAFHSESERDKTSTVSECRPVQDDTARFQVEDETEGSLREASHSDNSDDQVAFELSADKSINDEVHLTFYDDVGDEDGAYKKLSSSRVTVDDEKVSQQVCDSDMDSDGFEPRSSDNANTNKRPPSAPQSERGESQVTDSLHEDDPSEPTLSYSEGLRDQGIQTLYSSDDAEDEVPLHLPYSDVGDTGPQRLWTCGKHGTPYTCSLKGRDDRPPPNVSDSEGGRVKVPKNMSKKENDDKSPLELLNSEQRKENDYNNAQELCEVEPGTDVAQTLSEKEMESSVKSIQTSFTESDDATLPSDLSKTEQDDDKHTQQLYEKGTAMGVTQDLSKSETQNISESEKDKAAQELSITERTDENLTQNISESEKDKAAQELSVTEKTDENLTQNISESEKDKAAQELSVTEKTDENLTQNISESEKDKAAQDLSVTERTDENLTQNISESEKDKAAQDLSVTERTDENLTQNISESEKDKAAQDLSVTERTDDEVIPNLSKSDKDKAAQDLSVTERTDENLTQNISESEKDKAAQDLSVTERTDDEVIPNLSESDKDKAAQDLSVTERTDENLTQNISESEKDKAAQELSVTERTDENLTQNVSVTDDKDKAVQELSVNDRDNDDPTKNISETETEVKTTQTSFSSETEIDGDKVPSEVFDADISDAKDTQEFYKDKQGVHEHRIVMAATQDLSKSEASVETYTGVSKYAQTSFSDDDIGTPEMFENETGGDAYNATQELSRTETDRDEHIPEQELKLLDRVGPQRPHSSADRHGGDWDMKSKLSHSGKITEELDDNSSSKVCIDEAKETSEWRSDGSDKHSDNVALTNTFNSEYNANNTEGLSVCPAYEGNLACDKRLELFDSELGDSYAPGKIFLTIDAADGQSQLLKDLHGEDVDGGDESVSNQKQLSSTVKDVDVLKRFGATDDEEEKNREALVCLHSTGVDDEAEVQIDSPPSERGAREEFTDNGSFRVSQETAEKQQDLSITEDVHKKTPLCLSESEEDRNRVAQNLPGPQKKKNNKGCEIFSSEKVDGHGEEIPMLSPLFLDDDKSRPGDSFRSLKDADYSDSEVEKYNASVWNGLERIEGVDQCTTNVKLSMCQDDYSAGHGEEFLGTPYVWGVKGESLSQSDEDKDKGLQYEMLLARGRRARFQLAEVHTGDPCPAAGASRGGGSATRGRL